VVGWLPLSSSWFPTLLQKYVSHPKLRGLRHVAHGKADPDFLLSENFNRGIRTLTASGLTYDVPIREAQWSDAVHFMARHPDQVFVVDRLLRPLMGSVPSAEWVCFVRRLAAMPNVCCKLTGLVTEADWSGQTLAKLAPCLDVVLDAFGAERVMAASEWPVCLLATTYEQWWATLKMWAEALSDSEQVSIFGDTAKRVYRLETRRTLQKPASGLDVVRPGLYPHASWIGA
jgi:L-fuconolactonase